MLVFGPVVVVQGAWDVFRCVPVTHLLCRSPLFSSKKPVALNDVLEETNVGEASRRNAGGDRYLAPCERLNGDRRAG
jgi:hypothetical protein